MHVYKELAQPSTVTHSLRCKFTGSSKEDLIVVRGNSLLQVYKTIEFESVDESAQAQDEAINEGAGQDSFISNEVELQALKKRLVTKLVLVSEWPLAGFVTDIGNVKSTASSETDSLVISFKYAKAVLLIWDGANHTISTISLHYYEKDLWTDFHFADSEFKSYFRIDPQNTCMCFMYQKDQLAFLSFQQQEIFEETAANGINSSGVEQNQTVYYPSFLVPATKVDDSITNVIDFSFLHEYREPTIAFIFQPTLTWTGNIGKNKDTVSYLALSLDVQQRSSTPIISVKNLPYDIHTIVPLNAPVGGSFLVGSNELIHIDSSGKASGVAVNAYAAQITDMKLTDQSNLGLELEGSKVVPLEGEKYLLILFTGELYTISFNVEGRKVYGFGIARFVYSSDPIQNKEVWIAAPSTATRLGSRSIFIGSNTGAAKLLTWTYKGEKIKRNEKTAVAAADDLDEIYGGYDDASNGDTDKAVSRSALDILFSLNEMMLNYGPILSLTIGKSRDSLDHSDKSTYEIVAATGSESTGALSVFQKSVKPDLISRLHLTYASKIWALHPSTNIAGENAAILDSYVITSDEGHSLLFHIGDQFEDITNSKRAFFSNAQTVSIGLLGGGTHIVQVHTKGLVIYNAEFKKEQEISVKAQVESASFADPYMTIMFTNQTHAIFIADVAAKKTILSELKLDSVFPKEVSCSYTCISSILDGIDMPSQKGVKRKRGEEVDGKVEAGGPEPVIASINEQGELIVGKLSNPSKLLFRGIDVLSSVLDSQSVISNGSFDHVSKVEIKQILLSKIGDDVSGDYFLTILTTDNEIYLYKSFIYKKELRFRKVTDVPEASLLRGFGKAELVALEDVGGYSAVFITGDRPLIIMKGYQGPPRIHRFSDGPVIGITSFNTEAVYKGFAYVTSAGEMKIGGLKDDMDYAHSWPARQIPLNVSINSVCYQESSNIYVVATAEKVPFNYVDEDGNQIAGINENLPISSSLKSSVKLISPLTWTVIDEVSLADNEVIMSMKTVVLEVSEKTKRKKELIAFGTSELRGEDLAAKGAFYVYDAIDVVPEPGRPETSHKLKEVAKEDVKGAVTTLCEVDGHLLIAQGQKLVVRNLQEDNSIIPVAFLDMHIYISEAKSISNLLLLGDIMRGPVFAGFGREPYRMSVMGRDLTVGGKEAKEIVSGEFVVSKNNLHMVLADAHKRISILQYDPADPTSQSGQKLIRRSEFFTGRGINAMAKLPIMQDGEIVSDEFLCVGGSSDGTLISVTPLSESNYRSLYVIQQQIYDKDEQNACLNPRMHRALSAEPAITSSANSSQRQLLDYNALARFPTLSVNKKKLYSRKVGKNGLDDVLNVFRYLEETLNYF